VPRPRGYVPEVPGYELRERIGAGGMGEVWSAEQREGIRRAVAVKLIRAGMGTDQLLARFDAERQALALMDHPSIARVYDAGTTTDERPFFVMELIRGTPINEFCDRHRFDVEQRLELFLKVCDGVQHAHQRAIIHRDLKPSNILVTRQDDLPAPKIIDFGLAKALGHRLTDETVYTRHGEIVGTLEYMSPEQADPRGEEVDTRTDVYSLGMVLYVLLVGALPFDRNVVREGGLPALQRLITSQDPPRPSTRVSQLGRDSSDAAERRRTTPDTLSGTLRGDLDWIVMKALEKSPDRRYASVERLAADVRRYLGDLPVQARPPSAGYRVRKFVRRHRLEVAAATGVVIALVVGVVVATVGLVRARVAEREAIRQAETATRVTEFLVDLFEVSDPSQALGETITARELLERGTETVADLADEPVIRGHLEGTLGSVYSNLGLYDEATRLLESAVATLRGVEGEQAQASLAGSLHNLGVVYDLQGRYADAEQVFRDKLALAEQRDEPDEQELARTLNSLGIVLWNQGRYAESEEVFQRALTVREQLFGAESSEVAKTLFNLGNLAHALGELDRAEQYFTRALAIERAVKSPDHPDIAASLNNLGSLYKDLGRLDEARRSTEEALAIWEKVLGEDHPDVGIAVHNLGNLERDAGDLDRALELYARARGIWVATLGPDHVYVAVNDSQEAAARAARGETGIAEELYERSLATLERAVGSDHPTVAEALIAYAVLLDDTGRTEEAAELRTRAEGILTAVDGG
jgi:non-specific serine/threonine protein kinase/serine/threonine-protein kinase